MLNLYIGPHRGIKEEQWCGANVVPSHFWTPYEVVRKKVAEALEVPNLVLLSSFIVENKTTNHSSKMIKASQL